MDQLQPGCKVKILEGAFAGYAGSIQAIDGPQITVIVKIFGRETPLQLQSHQIDENGQDPRPAFRQELIHRLTGERTRKLADWWLQQLARAEDDLAGEYRAFLPFRTLVDTEHVCRTERLQDDFATLFTDRLVAEEQQEQLRLRWMECLERWGLQQSRADTQPLTAFECDALKRLKLIDDTLAPEAFIRQSWQEALDACQASYTATNAEEWTEEEWARIEAGWWKDFDRGSLSEERRLFLATWGVPGSSELFTPYRYRVLLWRAAEERQQRAEYVQWRQGQMPSPEELAALRAGARQQAEAQREPVQAFFQQVYHLTLPDHVFTFWAFWLGLTPRERAAMDWRIHTFAEITSALGISPCGIFAYFEQAGRERLPQAGLDHRLYERFSCDPPEFLTALQGDSDGLHFGLWYDNPQKPEAFVTSYYSRDGGGIGYEGQTLLEALREQIEWAEYHSNAESEPEERRRYRLSIKLLRDAVMEYETGDRPEQGEEYIATLKKLEGRIPTYNELGVVVPPPYEQALERDAEAIGRAICDDAPPVQTWIAEALQACTQGQPALALALGHDLHWLSHDQQARKEAAHLLLSKAYAVLGYQALAEIASLHHQYRDLPNVDIYHFRYHFTA